MDLPTFQSVSGQVCQPDQIDPETVRLINELLTHLGMSLEDTSATALLKDSCGGSLSRRVKMIEAETTRMQFVCSAATALLKG